MKEDETGWKRLGWNTPNTLLALYYGTQVSPQINVNKCSTAQKGDMEYILNRPSCPERGLQAGIHQYRKVKIQNGHPRNTQVIG
jgi:hypothetical protein